MHLKDVTRTGGSIFLFDRKAVRFFRKDGHNWRKKADGKTVRETHEKLKVRLTSVLMIVSSPQRWWEHQSHYNG
jgi:CG-1 domain